MTTKPASSQRQPRGETIFADANGGVLAQRILAAVLVMIKHRRRRIFDVIRQDEVTINRIADAVQKGKVLQRVIRFPPS